MVEISEKGRKSFAQLLARKFPDRKFIKINNLREITAGWETKIYSFSLEYAHNERIIDEELVIRFFQGPDQKEQAKKEYTLMKRVLQFGIPVPRVDLVVTEDSPFKHAFIVMEKINGETLANVLQAAPEGERIRLLHTMSAYFVQLHQIPQQKIFTQEGYTGLTHNDPLEYVTSNLRDMKYTIQRYRLYEFDPLINWLEARKGLGATSQLCVLHNDYHPLNIIHKKSNGGLVILDWSFAEIGDYRMDLAWTVLLIGVMLGVRYREVMLRRYEEIAGAKVENLEFFEALKFAMRMLTIATWLDESVEIPVKKITRQAMRNEYKVHIHNVYHRLREVTGLRLPSIENL